MKTVHCVCLALLAAVAVVDAVGSWTQKSSVGPYSPSARYFHSQAGKGNFAYVFGGTDGTTQFRDIFSYNINKGNVYLLDSGLLHGPGGRSGHCSVHIDSGTGHDTEIDTDYVVRNETIFIFGGFDGTNYLNDAWAFDVPTSSWSKLDLTGAVPSPRAHHSCVTMGAGSDLQVLVFGGYDGTDFFGGHNGEFVMLDYDDQVWDVPADNNPLFLVPSQRAGVVAVAQGGSLYVYGGQSRKGCLDDTWVWYPVSSSWHHVPSTINPPSLCGYAGFLGEGGGYNLFGGFEECKTASNQIWHISHDHTQWEQVPVVGNVPPARGGTVATSHGSYDIVLYGGVNAPVYDVTATSFNATVFNDIWIYTENH